MSNFVFVLNGDGQPLSPCHPAVARKLLKRGRATVERVIPFAIRLVEIKPDPGKQPTTIGIDDGAKTAGVAIVQHNQGNDRVVFKAEIKLRNNVKKELSNRRMRRRARRSRLRHRQPRKRRGDKTGWIPPSIRVRKDNVLRTVRDLTTLVPITQIVYEEGQFDTRKLWDSKVTDYRQGPGSGHENRKKAILWRDKYRCQYCGVDCIEASLVAEIDHVIPKSRGGTWAYQNLVCACRICNREKGNRTASEFGHPQVQGRTFTYPAHLQQGKIYIKARLAEIAPVQIVFGWQTAQLRKQRGLIKSHVNDALSLVLQRDEFIDRQDAYQVIARRRRSDMHNIRHRSYAGFKHLDVVRYARRDGRQHIGTVRSFVPGRKVIKCRFDFSDNWGVSVRRLTLVQRARSLDYALLHT